MSHVLSLRLAAMARIARGEEEDVDPELVNVTDWADALERASAELRRREEPVSPPHVHEWKVFETGTGVPVLVVCTGCDVTRKVAQR